MHAAARVIDQPGGPRMQRCEKSVTVPGTLLPPTGFLPGGNKVPGTVSEDRPEYPTTPFENLEAADAWAANFVQWYNAEHLHSEIRFVTPGSRHSGTATKTLMARAEVYRQARERNPDRWGNGLRNWAPVTTVRLNPKPNKEVKFSA